MLIPGEALGNSPMWSFTHVKPRRILGLRGQRVSLNILIWILSVSKNSSMDCVGNMLVNFVLGWRLQILFTGWLHTWYAEWVGENEGKVEAFTRRNYASKIISGNRSYQEKN